MKYRPVQPREHVHDKCNCVDIWRRSCEASFVYYNNTEKMSETAPNKLQFKKAL